MKINYILAFCGPSGSGKSTFVEELLTNYSENFTKWKQVTTRPKREEETNQYIFTSLEKFEQIKSRLTCLTNFNGNYYGTIPQEIENKDVITIVDPEGLISLKNDIEKNNSSVRNNVTGIFGNNIVELVSIFFDYEITQENIEKRGRKSRGLDFINEEKNKIQNYQTSSEEKLFIKINNTEDWMSSLEFINILKEKILSTFENEEKLLKNRLEEIKENKEVLLNKEIKPLEVKSIEEEEEPSEVIVEKPLEEEPSETLRKMKEELLKKNEEEIKVISTPKEEPKVEKKIDEKKAPWNDKYTSFKSLLEGNQDFDIWLASDGGGPKAFNSSGTFRGTLSRFMAERGMSTVTSAIRCHLEEFKEKKTLDTVIKRFLCTRDGTSEALFIDYNLKTKKIFYGICYEIENKNGPTFFSGLKNYPEYENNTRK